MMVWMVYEMATAGPGGIKIPGLSFVSTVLIIDIEYVLQCPGSFLLTGSTSFILRSHCRICASCGHDGIRGRCASCGFAVPLLRSPTRHLLMCAVYGVRGTIVHDETTCNCCYPAQGHGSDCFAIVLLIVVWKHKLVL